MNYNHSNSSSQLSLFASGVSRGKLRLLDDYITTGKVLDIGCGNGLYGFYLETKGCDVSQIDLIDRRNSEALHIPFQIIDAHYLELVEHTFDYVLAFDIMEHLDDDAKFLQDTLRICRHRIFLSVPNSDDEQIVKIGLTHKHHKDKTHCREYTKEQLETLLVNNGYKILTIRPNYAVLNNFPIALAKDRILSKIAARFLRLQCKILFQLGLFENRTIGDWYCVAEKL